MDVISTKLFLYIVIVLSATFHEYAHGFIAYKLGDSTAKDAGRLTLNPLAHIDLMGTVIIPLFLLLSPAGVFLGWAKPVPYNPYNLKDQKYGSLKVGIAGPSANLIIAVILGIFLRLAFTGIFGAIFSQFFLTAVALIVYINIFLALFNLIPFPPLDGSKVLMDLFPRSAYALARFGFIGIFFALFLAFFVLSPLAGFLFQLITGQGFSF